MNRLFSCLATTLLLAASAGAQRTIDVEKNLNPQQGRIYYAVGGVPFTDYKSVRLVEGTPYFREDWQKAIVVLGDGTVFKDVSVKLNLLDQELNYLDDKGAEMVTSQPMREIVIGKAPGLTVTFIHSSMLPSSFSKKGWYEELVFDSVSLYRLYEKRMVEQKPYGSATIEQKIYTKERYFLVTGDKVTEVRKLKELVLQLPDKKEELEKFAKTLPDTSPEGMLIALVEQYNLLKKAGK